MSSQSNEKKPFRVLREANVQATMRDGTVLRADVYRPDAPGKFPILLQRTPYDKSLETSAEITHRLAECGYVSVI